MFLICMTLRGIVYKSWVCSGPTNLSIGEVSPFPLLVTDDTDDWPSVNVIGYMTGYITPPPPNTSTCICFVNPVFVIHNLPQLID